MLNSIAIETILNFNISFKSLFYGQIISVLKLYAWILSYSVEILFNFFVSLCMAEFTLTYLCQNNASIKLKLKSRSAFHLQSLTNINQQVCRFGFRWNSINPKVYSNRSYRVRVMVFNTTFNNISRAVVAMIVW